MLVSTASMNLSYGLDYRHEVAKEIPGKEGTTVVELTVVENRF